MPLNPQSLLAGMTHWPYPAESLKPTGELCPCGAPWASVTDGKDTFTGCSKVLTGTAEGGPGVHSQPRQRSQQSLQQTA